MVDINGDGIWTFTFPSPGPNGPSRKHGPTLLFINNGDHTSPSPPHGTVSPIQSFTTHAVFLDYNGDGHLDLFLLNNSPDDFARGEAEHPPASAARASQLQRAVPQQRRRHVTNVSRDRDTTGVRIWARRGRRRLER